MSRVASASSRPGCARTSRPISGPRQRIRNQIQGLVCLARREAAAPGRAQVRRAAWSNARSIGFDDGVNGLLARGLRRVLVIACRTYEQLLEDHALLDFAGMLERAVELLSRQEEFARSRMKLQSRYHHVLVDEFQDTSRRQWKLVELLIDAWGEGEGSADAPTSVFVVGDRKQSIYRFRQAEVALLDEAARKIGAAVRGAIRHAIDHAQLPRGAGAAGVRQCARHGGRGERTGDRRPLPVRRIRSLPRAGGGRRRPARRHARPGRGRRADAGAARPPPSRRKSSTCSRRPPSATATRRRGRPGRTTSRFSFARARDTASSRTRSRRAASAPTSTRGSASSTRPKSRTSRPSCATSRGPTRIFAPPSGCGRDSSACRTTAWRALAPDFAGAIRSPDVDVARPRTDAGGPRAARTRAARHAAVAGARRARDARRRDGHGDGRVRVHEGTRGPPARSGPREHEESPRARPQGRKPRLRDARPARRYFESSAPAKNRTPSSPRRAACT